MMLFKICLSTNSLYFTVKNSKGSEYVIGWNSDGWFEFDGIVGGSFSNGSARNLAIFSVCNSSSSHTNNPKNNFLVLSEGDTFGTNESFIV